MRKGGGRGLGRDDKGENYARKATVLRRKRRYVGGWSSRVCVKRKGREVCECV